VLYAGTDVGLYRSADAGRTWSVVEDGLPAVSIWDVALSEPGRIVRVATHGRGFFECGQ
jgi:hypothetical protein